MIRAHWKQLNRCSAVLGFIHRRTIHLDSLDPKLRIAFTQTRRVLNVHPKPLGLRSYSSQELPPHVVITMPALSPTMSQGNLSQWKKKVGNNIKIGESIALIETDKATMDFESQEDGYLAKILVEEGTRDVPINQPVAIIVENKEDIEKFKDFTPEATNPHLETDPEVSEPTDDKGIKTTPPSKASTESTHKNIEQSNSADKDRVFASPLAKSLAKESGVSLKNIKGTGPNNTIVKNDVIAAPSGQSKLSSTSKETFFKTPLGLTYTDKPLTNMRKTIAKRLYESASTIPHFYLTKEINVDLLLSLRSKLNLEEKFKISINDFIIKASALTLRDLPSVNASWIDGTTAGHGPIIREYKNIDISVAVSTGDGLITPIIKSADEKGLVLISNLVKDLAHKAKNNTLLPEDYQGGTFTISNLGMFGIHQFTAIINPPQSCILAVGLVEEKPYLVETPSKKKSTKSLEMKSVLKVTLSCDHRVVDGALGAKWLQIFADYMEDPAKMLL